MAERVVGQGSFGIVFQVMSGLQILSYLFVKRKKIINNRKADLF